MKAPRKLRGEEGAAAVEFALIVGLLFVILFGIMEFGLAFFELQNLRSSAREGARAAAIGGTRTEVSQALVQGASGSLDNGYTSFTPGGSGPFCNTKGAEIKITLPISSLPARVQAAFQVDIPFLPQIQLTPTISGSFRCE
ncbi:MAG: TadE family protein [Actinomycetota bacterium]